MADQLTPERRSQNMAMIRARDTKPEMTVRRLLHRLGYRFRLHKRGLPGRPDLVFASRKKVIFVHGCFWHQHASSTCKIARRPKSRGEYWNAKLDRNVARDGEVKKALEKAGWKSLTLWECQIKKRPEWVAGAARKFLEG